MKADTSTALSSKKKILVVTSDLPSHPYACVKLAKVLAESGHNVTLASPAGPAYDRIKREILAFTSPNPTVSIRAISIGKVQTKNHVNVRPVVDPQSYSALFNGIRHPLPLAEAVEKMFDNQEEMYQNLTKIIGQYDLVFAIHSTAATVCDAVESLAATTGNQVPCIIFSSMPYESSWFNAGKDPHAWAMPRTVVTLPHVATYPPPRTVTNPVALLIQLFWMALDSFIVDWAWKRAYKYGNARRARRGLPPVNGYRSYLQKYPVLTFGGTHPYISQGEEIADNVTCIGSTDSERSDVELFLEIKNTGASFSKWFYQDDIENTSMNDRKIILAAFGTGTMLNDKEVANVVRMAKSHQLNSTHRVLFALRTEEQKRLRSAIDSALSSSPTDSGDDYLEYFNGDLRIQSSIPQVAVLESGKVSVFLSHMGFGGFSEGVRAAVPFVVYPSGCDQWYNAVRAVEAGIAVRSGTNMTHVESAVLEVINSDEINKESKRIAEEARKNNAERTVQHLIDEILFVSDLTKKFRQSLASAPYVGNGVKSHEIHPLALLGDARGNCQSIVYTRASISSATAA